jgi:plasmid maintenance system antidote protein VapI
MSVFALVLLVLEGVFFLTCFRWLSSGKRAREREFARLDSERSELVELQQAVARDLREAKKLSEETLVKLKRVGADAHEEWIEMNRKCEHLVTELEDKLRELADVSVGQINRQKMQLEKTIQVAGQTHDRLTESAADARKILRFLDENVPSDEVLKELQAEKYAEARRLIQDGKEIAVICRKLGLSQSEVQLLSYMG